MTKYLSTHVFFFFFAIVAISLVAACSGSDPDMGKTPIARVYDNYLYLEDLEDLSMQNMTAHDSSEKVQMYIDTWAKTQLLRRKAELNLPEDQLDVNRQLEDYKSNLLIHKYKQRFISQKLDTNITDAEMSEYYNKHKTEFKLDKPAVKALFIKLPATAPNLDQLKKRCKSNAEKDSVYVNEYCYMHAAAYDSFVDEWVYFDDLLSKMPVEIINKESFLSGRQYIETSDEEFYYLVKIFASRMSGDIAPLSFIRKPIKSVILNKKKQKLVSTLENDLYEDALNHDNFEVIHINKD